LENFFENDVGDDSIQKVTGDFSNRENVLLGLDLIEFDEQRWCSVIDDRTLV
jgi:hypothetical protein